MLYTQIKAYGIIKVAELKSDNVSKLTEIKPIIYFVVLLRQLSSLCCQILTIIGRNVGKSLRFPNENILLSHSRSFKVIRDYTDE